ncbi:hypothetical protein EMCG_03064 [[Emmonsia] crescens]|uniref:Uncharacterized protein n=1 Tax=[Emmonsia] crescens TaxID=73230 RepID=A0A0G2J0P6_9EURO|nr:hypothetical protein EMCG_03064 [Emmonsia crescens UAMH 3008]
MAVSRNKGVGLATKIKYGYLLNEYFVLRQELHAGDDGSNMCTVGQGKRSTRQRGISYMLAPFSQYGMKSTLQTPVHWGFKTLTKRIGQMQEITSYWADHITSPSEDAAQGRVISKRRL